MIALIMASLVTACGGSLSPHTDATVDEPTPRDAGLEEVFIADAGRRAERVFVSAGYQSQVAYYDFGDVPAAPPGDGGPTIVQLRGVITPAGNRIYGPRADSFAWLDQPSTALLGPFTLVSFSNNTVAYGAAYDDFRGALYVVTNNSGILRFDSAKTLPPNSKPSATIAGAFGRVRTDKHDRLYGIEYDVVDVYPNASVGTPEAQFSLPWPWKGKFQAQIVAAVVDEDRLWLGGTDGSGLSGNGAVVVGYDLASLNAGSTPAVTLNQLAPPGNGGVLSLDARAGRLFVGLWSSAGSEVVVFDELPSLDSKRMGIRIPTSGAHATRYSERTGWLYVAGSHLGFEVITDPFGTPTRHLIHSFESPCSEGCQGDEIEQIEPFP
jgi:hypothetical protein